ncbi:MAG TPA: hypothetical protein VIJ15_14235 [Dermatophilaceae bacterium]
MWVDQPGYLSSPFLVDRSADASEQVTARFAAGHHEVLASIGGAWRRVADGRVDANRQWFVAGSPLQVAIGFSESDVVAGAVQVSPPLLFHPEELSIDRPSSAVPLSDAQAHIALRRRLIAAQKRRRDTFQFCSICRTYLPPEAYVGSQPCRGCNAQYFGLMID